MNRIKKIIRHIYREIITRISPIEISGGLSVSDSAIRYIRFNEDGVVGEKASLRLPAGAVSEGRIINNEIVIGALTTLRNKIKIPASRKAEVIFSLESNSIYSQLYALPQLQESFFAEAAELNVQAISPIDIKTAYYSYQIVGSSSKTASSGYDLLGAFIKSSVADDWISACKTAGFMPVAVEFQTLSIARAITELAQIRESGITMVINVVSEGINFIVIKNNNLYFDHFYPWKFIQEKDKPISIEKLKQVILAETNKVVSFAVIKFSGTLSSIRISAEGTSEAIITGLKEQYPTIPVTEITIKDKQAPFLWLAALGAAKRGLLLRSEDAMISLTPQQVIEEYENNQVIAMICLWRKISTIILCFFIVIFSLGNLFLRQVLLDADQQLLRGLSPEEEQELNVFREKANEFNSLLALIKGARALENNIYPFVTRILTLEEDIRITNFSFRDIALPIELRGSAPSSTAVIQFQKRLEKEPNITELRLPIADLVTTSDDRVTFVMSFRITSLDF